MDDKQRLQLQNMIKVNNVQDQTNLIRDLKHSHILQTEINNLLRIKNTFKGDPEKINMECINECGFLFNYYTDLYNKIKKDEIDLSILNKFINILRQIEDGEVDQHEGSFMVGTILKELYIDSALKKAEKINEINDYVSKGSDKTRVIRNISWYEFKNKIIQ
jgi:hypothetical protein